MEETDGLLALPYRSPTLNCPLIQMIAFPFFAKCTDLLMTRKHGIYDNQVFILCIIYLDLTKQKQLSETRLFSKCNNFNKFYNMYNKQFHQNKIVQVFQFSNPQARLCLHSQKKMLLSHGFTWVKCQSCQFWLSSKCCSKFYNV